MTNRLPSLFFRNQKPARRRNFYDSSLKPPGRGVFKTGKAVGAVRLICVFVFCAAAFPGHGREASGYKYTLKNYFADRKPNESLSQGYFRRLGLYIGTSVHGEEGPNTIKPFSTMLLGLSQRLREFPLFGSADLRVELRSMRLSTHREWLISVTPVFSLPDVSSGFPVYAGAGGGVGLFPRHLVKKRPVLSLNALLFGGVRMVDWYENAGAFGEVGVQFQLPFYEMKTVYGSPCHPGFSLQLLTAMAGKSLLVVFFLHFVNILKLSSLNL